jgi:hypothetical protein
VYTQLYVYTECIRNTSRYIYTAFMRKHYIQVHTGQMYVSSN